MSTPYRPQLAPGVVAAEWWHPLEGGRLQCDVCPRYCKLHDGQRGFCFVREARGDQLVLSSYARASGFCIDPIEKKPLNHFLPGSAVLSFGTAGCNLGCRFCQNWDISKARDADVLSAEATPDRVADVALSSGCASVAFTYNDPIIFAEYAIDCAKAARERGLRSVAVTSGYMAPEARRAFYSHMDAVNVDLKAFTEEFYHKTCAARLAPVLDTLKWLRNETSVWLELTTLLIPGLNDSAPEVAALCDWVASNLGPETPLHFTAFHPDFKLQEVPATPPETLIRARAQGRAAGLRHVYTGNVRDPAGQSTYCAGCGQLIIGRDRYAITGWRLDESARCAGCGRAPGGHFAARPGQWGPRRLPIAVA